MVATVETTESLRSLSTDDLEALAEHIASWPDDDGKAQVAAQIEAEIFRRWPAAFRATLNVDSDGRVVRLGDVMDPWQDEDFRALDPGWLRCIGVSHDDGSLARGYLERPRGHSKTSDLAVMVVWALAYTPRLIRGVGCAADWDQAHLLRDAIDRLVQLNPWLRSILQVNQRTVTNIDWRSLGRGSRLDIIPSHVGSSYGILPDFVVADEIVHWEKEAFWHSVSTSAGKRSNCMLVVISNAGLGAGSSWQWKTREACRKSDAWYFSSLDGPQASWITAPQLDEAREILPATVYQRLWGNVWSTEAGDALDARDIESCTVLDEPPGYTSDNQGPFLAALDLGLKNDHSALVVVQADVANGRVVLMDVKSWSPEYSGGQVSLAEVREACRRAHRLWDMPLIYDPWQAELMAEDLRADGIECHERTFTPANCNEMATSLIRCFRNRTLELFSDPRLIDDLLRLKIVERQTGYRLEAIRDERGHCDRATALAMVCPDAEAILHESIYAGNAEDAAADEVAQLVV
jgi:hypothetical protein